MQKNKWEHELEDIIHLVKSGGDLSDYQKDPNFTHALQVIQILLSMPKIKIPNSSISKVKSRVLNQIALPERGEVVEESQSFQAGFFQLWPRVVKVSVGVAAGFLIMVSLTLGTAVAALQSVPGDAIYPLKKVVENIQLKLTTDEQEKADLQIRFALNRLDELEQMLEKNTQGQILEDEAQKIVTETVKELQATTAAAVAATASPNVPPKISTLTKLVELSSKQEKVLKEASIQTEGDVRIEIEKALEASKISKEEAIENIERAGLQVEEQVITIDPDENQDSVKTYGKITATTSTSVNIGSVKFILDKNTQYVGIESGKLQVDQIVSIQGEIRNNQTYAVVITLEKDPNQETLSPATETQTQEPQTNTENQ